MYLVNMWSKTIIGQSGIQSKPTKITSKNSLFEQIVLNPYFVVQLFSLTLSFCENDNHYFINFNKPQSIITYDI